MRLTILSFVFILLYHVSIGQVTITNNYVEDNSTTCPLMEVNITSNNNNIVEVAYCNHGNATAIGAYVEIEITNDLFITQSTIPVASVVNQKYIFNLGNVNSSDCGVFYVEIPNVDNKMHCTNTHIFPNNPCQAMIDRYISDNTKDEGYDDVVIDNNDDGVNDDTNNNKIAVTYAADMDYSTPGLPYLGQGGINSVFEDHVFLNNIPTWDSLLLVLTNSGVLPMVNTDGGSNVAVMAALDDITTLSTAELCFNKKGSAVVLTDIPSQITSVAIDDRTVYGGTTNNQGASNQIATSVAKNKFENQKEAIVRLYPNPFSTVATVSIDGASYKEATLEIVDLTGKSIRSLQVAGQHTITLYRDNLSQGVYLYRLIGDNTIVHTGKFVVR